jgi:hypothetical protein
MRLDYLVGGVSLLLIASAVAFGITLLLVNEHYYFACAALFVTGVVLLFGLLTGDEVKDK